MRKILSIGLIIFCSLFAVSGLRAESDSAVKYGFVDLAKVFDEYQKTKDYSGELEKKQEGKLKEREKLVEEIKELQGKFSLLNDKEKENAQGAIDQKIQSLDEFERKAKLDLRKEEFDLTTEIMKEIEKAIGEFAQKEKYTFIFKKYSLLYGQDSLEVTDQILKSLNEKYAKTKAKK